MTPLVEGGDIVEPLRERVLGRAAAVDVLAPGSDKVVLEAGTLLDESAVKTLEQYSIDQVLVRSPITCADEVRRLRAVLRPRLGARPSRQPGRGRRRHCGAVDRRARHAAHDAHVPHRRRSVALGRGEQRRGQEHRHDPLHQRKDGHARAEGPPHHDVALRRARRDRRVRPRARALQGAVRRDARRQGRRSRATGPARRELGSAYAPGRHGGQRLPQVRGLHRRRDGDVAGRRDHGLDEHRRARCCTAQQRVPADGQARRRPRQGDHLPEHRHPGGVCAALGRRAQHGERCSRRWSATCSRGCRKRARRLATSRAVCRASRTYSRRAVRRTRRSSPSTRAPSASARRPRASVGSSSPTRRPRSTRSSSRSGAT